MNELYPHPNSMVPVLSGTDRFGERRSLGISSIEFKVVAEDSNRLFVLENTFHSPGGPPRHLHHAQDEWFYVVEGDFRFVIGEEPYCLRSGDSVLAPRRVPHVWAFTGCGRGRIIVAFTPPGDMEAFFLKIASANAMPGQDPELWRAHGMELLGPPLKLE